MTHAPAKKIEPEEVIDRIYEIALEPSSLDEFVDFWHDSGLAERIAENADGVSAEFDELYQSHIERAQVFLQRGDDARPDFTEFLSPYDNLAAFIVSTSFRVEAANPGGQALFHVTSGDHLEDLCLPTEMRDALIRTIKQVLRGKPYSEKLLKTDMGSKSGAVLFRVTQLGKHLEDGPAVLVVSTKFHWRNSVSELLAAVFQLTKSEQDIVRLLTDGKTVKHIATERNVSEGTVRGQVKVIIGKMNIRGQGDIIRLAMTFSKFSSDASGDMGTLNPASPALSGNWLEAEVWKPFKSVSLPDHRQLTYHDMGPPTGNPVLFSHMGSCMVRWSPSMIKLAYKHNLRVICPIRAGYGHSDRMASGADPFSVTRNDCAFLLESLRVPRLPYVVQGSDLPFAVDMVANRPELISELIAIGGQLHLPGGQSVEGAGRWQKFFVALARNAPNMVQFAAKAVMAMSRRIGPEAMLRQLCKDSPADLAIIDSEEMRPVLVANINLMASKSTNAAGAFALEYIAFQKDWSTLMMATSHIPVRMFLAQEDPTIDLSRIPEFKDAYPWIEFEVLQDAGLALMYQKPEKLIGLMAEAAHEAAKISR